jgi:hypothetical protein
MAVQVSVKFEYVFGRMYMVNDVKNDSYFTNNPPGKRGD